MIQVKNASSKMSNEDALAALADLFAEKVSTKKKASTEKKPPKPVTNRPLAQRFAEAHTGYLTWKAIARVVHLEQQECTCCGALVVCVRDEFFLLENGQAHARWARHEGYGIDHVEELPIETELLPDVRFVSACGACNAVDIELALLSVRQMELSL